MPIIFACPCGKKLRAKDESTGVEFHCPKCGLAIVVPASDCLDIGIVTGPISKELRYGIVAPLDLSGSPLGQPSRLRSRSVLAYVVLLFGILSLGIPLGIMAVTQLHGERRAVAGLEEVVARCETSVAIVRGPDSAGSGFLASPGLIVTNAHVISQIQADDIRVLFPSATQGQRGPLRARVVFFDEARDLAVLAVDSRLSPLELDGNHTFRRGQEVAFIGNPVIGGSVILELVAGRGVIGSRIQLGNLVYYQLSGSVNGGNSGGPVLDMDGRVIGIVTAKAAKEEGIGFCIPARDVALAISIASAEGSFLSADAAVRHFNASRPPAIHVASSPPDERVERRSTSQSSSARNVQEELRKRMDREEAQRRQARRREAERQESEAANQKAFRIAEAEAETAEMARKAAELFRLGQSLEKQGKLRGAIGYYLDLVDDFPELAEANLAASRISALDSTPKFDSPAVAVLRVLDGMTIVVARDQKEETIRLLGLQPFPKTRPPSPRGTWEDLAREYLIGLLEGGSVWLFYEPGVGHLDSGGRTLAYVYRNRDKLFINREVIAKGFGMASQFGIFSRGEEFRSIGARALSRKAGVWAP